MALRIVSHVTKTFLFSVNPLRFGFLLLVLAVSGVLMYEDRQAVLENEFLTEEIGRLTEEQQDMARRMDAAVAFLEENLDLTKSQQELLRADLMSEKEKAGALQAQLGQVSGTVNTLEKLTNTDEELLQKYSKIYFLNEHYIPARLSRIEPAYVYLPDGKPRDLQIHASVKPYLENMIADGVDILVTSAYRSFGVQEDLKSQYVVTYGAGTANQFSADQGYSEHQLGTTIDFTTKKTGADWGAFESSATFTWLTKNAYLYGFTLSYSKNNAFYEYEPWHWRFVGKELAKRLKNDGTYFYDLDQREIDTYLVSIFD